MSDTLPFMNAYGQIGKIFDKMHSARKPAKFTQDFLETILGFKSKSARAIVPLPVKLGFLTSDKIPTELYSEFQNPKLKKHAVAKGMKKAYAALFEINTYLGDAEAAEVEGIICQATGLGKDEDKFKVISKTFISLREIADFSPLDENKTVAEAISTDGEQVDGGAIAGREPIQGKTRLGWSYTINLNLPETTDIEVFDAIFASMKKNFPDI